MRKIYSILSRVFLGGALILALTPCASCGSDGTAMGKGMQCPNTSCCQTHHGCHHQTPKDCQHLMKTQVEGVVYAKSIKPVVAIPTVKVPHLIPSNIGPTAQAFHQLLMIQSPPGSSLVLRI